MLILVSAAILIITSLTILAARLRRPRFGFAWLASVGGSLAAFAAALAAKPAAPQIVALGSWQPRVLLPVSPVLLIDSISWSFVVGALALNLAAAVTRIQDYAGGERAGEHPLELAGVLLLAVTAVFASAAGNVLSLLLAWTALDLVTAVIRLPRSTSYRQTELILLALAARLVGSWLMVWAGLLTSARGLPTSVTTIGPDSAALLLAAVLLRIGLPLRLSSDPVKKTGSMHAVLDLLPAGTVWAAAARVAAADPPRFEQAFIWLGAGIALYGGIRLFRSGATRSGLPFWTAGITGWVIGCAALGRPFAALSAGLAGICCGGVLRLAETRPLSARIILGIGGLLLSGLPLTPTWAAVGMYEPPYHPAMFLYLLSWGAILAGYIRHAARLAPPPKAAERWFWAIYPLGLAALPAALLLAAWTVRPGAAGGMPSAPGWIAAGLGAVAPGGALAFTAAFYRFRRRRSGAAAKTGPRAIPAYIVFRRLLGLIRRQIQRIGWALEGRAGLLWALLMLALMISLFIQLGGEPPP